MKGRGTLWIPPALALLAGWYTWWATPPEGPPLSLIALFGPAPDGVLDLRGGVRATVVVDGDRAAADEVAAGLRDRLAALADQGAPPGEVRRAGTELFLEIPQGDGLDLAASPARLVRSAGLSFAEVADDDPLPNRLAAHLSADPTARAAGVVARPGSGEWEYARVSAPSRSLLEGALELAQTADPTLRPAPPLWFGFARPGAGEEDPRWSLLLLRGREDLGGRPVDRALPLFEESGVPYLSVEFTPEAGERFGELTFRLVGRRLAMLVDDEVLSAPIVKETITGGRIKLTLGGNDSPSAQVAEIRALAAALSAGPLAAPARVTHVEEVAARIGRNQLDAARALFAAALALAVLLLGFGLRALGRSLSRPAADVPGAPTGPAAPAAGALGPLARRLLVTLAGVAAVPVLLRLRLFVPGVDADAFEALLGAPTLVSAFSLGVTPVLSGFALVELAALAVPRWRRLRHAGPDGRRSLLRAAVLVSIATLTIQSLGITYWLNSLFEVDMAAVFDLDTALAGGVSLLPVFATFLAGTGSLVALALFAGRFGLADAFSTVLLGLAVDAAFPLFAPPAAPPGSAAAPAVLDAAAVAATVVGAALLAGGTFVVLAARARDRDRDGRLGLRLPLAGIVPIALATSWLAYLRSLGWLFDDLAWLGELFDPAAPHSLALLFGLPAATTLLFGWLFTWPRRLRPLAVRAGAPPAGVHPALVRGLVYSLLFVLGFVAVGWACAASGAPLARLDLVWVAVAAAVGMDLVDEWRARRRLGPIVPVWPLHRVQAIDLVQQRLAAAGIAAHVRAARHRALLHFYGPFVPATVFVAPAQAEEARTLIADLFAPEIAPARPTAASAGGGDAGDAPVGASAGA